MITKLHMYFYEEYICRTKAHFSVVKVTGYPLNNFVGANIYCLEKQPYRVLHLMASSPPSNYCAKNLQTPLIKPPMKQSDDNQWLLFLLISLTKIVLMAKVTNSFMVSHK